MQHPPNKASQNQKEEILPNIGTVSADKKILIDSNGNKYYIADQLSTKELAKHLAIADASFNGKYKITKVTIKNGRVTGGTVTFLKPCNKKIKSASIGTTVKIAGIKTKKLKRIGKNAFKNISANAKFKVPKKQLKKYPKIIKKAKAPKKSVIS